jgi:SAM-dependent methyltransferase
VERHEYAKLDRFDEEMWWFRGLHANLVAEFRRRDGATADASGGAVLDVGCGTGGLLARLARELPQAVTIGLDADPDACRAARAKSRRPVCAGSANGLPCRDGALAALFSADVLCHRNVDPAEALREFRRCLAPGGILVINLPAYGWLLSAHDRAVHNVRRFSRGQLRRMLESAGFARIRATYWNTILFPLMVLRRTVLGSPRGSSDVMSFPAPLEQLFRGVMRLESRLLGSGLHLPFGGSILASAVKP